MQLTSLQSIFDQLKESLAYYQKDNLQARIDQPDRYELWSKKEAIVNNKKRKEVFFASLIIQSKYVGFYFMPAYTEDQKDQMFSSGLLKLLKGKSCFHVKELDDKLLSDIELSLKKGYQAYQKRQWV